MTGTVFKIFTGILLPWILCGGVIAIAGSISGRKETDQILKLIKSSVKWTIGIIFTVFLSTLSVRGLSAAGVDSVSIKTLKYALDKSVPVVGGMLSGTYDTVRAYTLLIKNAAGITASIVVVGSLLTPAFEIIVTTIALRILSAVGALVSNPEISRMFSNLADIYTYVFGALVTRCDYEHHFAGCHGSDGRRGYNAGTGIPGCGGRHGAICRLLYPEIPASAGELEKER